jgi:hypothetical protein
MADDLGYTPGAGATVATDEVGGAHYQRMKLTLGADGDNDGDVSEANPMPVAGNVDHDEVDAGAPVKIGGYASEARPASVADGQRVNASFSPRGALRVELWSESGAGGWVTGDTLPTEPDPGSPPVKVGGVASSAAPSEAFTDDGDRVDAWFLRNGAQATVVTAGGDLIGGDDTNGLDVDVTRLPSLPAGNANIGDVGIASIAAGDNNIGNVDVVTLPALPAGNNNIGDVDVATLPNVTIGTMAALVAGTANIGDVDVLTVPSPLSTAGNGTAAAAHRVTIASDSTGVVGLAAGTNNIGDVDVLTLPNVTIGTNAPLVAGTANIGDVDVLTLPSIPAGSNNIGDVDVLTLPNVTIGTMAALVAGNANIGDVDVASMPNTDTDRLKVVAWDTDLLVGSGMTALRDLLVAERYTQISDSIADGIGAIWTSTTANTGTTTSSGGEGLIQSNANAAGSAQLVSTVMDYRPGQVNWLNSAVRLGDTGSAGNVRRWGAFTVSGTTPQEGYYYELNGTTLNAVVVKAGTPTAVASGSWSKFATNPFTLTTNYTQFEIRYTANTVWFYINNALVHAVSGTTTPLTTHLNFPMALQSINSSGASNRILAVRNIGMGGFGQRPGTTTNTVTSTVAGSASSVTILAANGGRKGATVVNDSTVLLYLKLGTTASATDYTVKMAADQYYEVPFNYTGRIDGIWASATGNARITELT